jgi:hypothetical protein
VVIRRRCYPGAQLGGVTAVAVLDWEMYWEAEATLLLRVAQETLHYLLERGTQAPDELATDVSAKAADHSR